MSRRVAWLVALAVVAIALLAAVAVARLAYRPPGTGSDTPGIGSSWSSSAILVGSKIVVVDDVAISVVSVKPVDASLGMFGPAKGNRFLLVEVRVENRGTERVETPESGCYALRTAGGRTADYAPVAVLDPEPPAAIVGKGSYNVRTPFEVPITGSLTFLMEPNTITDRVIEISLVRPGGPKPKTEMVTTQAHAGGRGRDRRTSEVRQAAIGQPIALIGCTMTVLACGPWKSDEEAVYRPETGHRFLGVRVRISSTSADIFGIGPENVRLQDAGGSQWGVVPMDNQARDVSDEGYIYIQPDRIADWTIPFEVPIGATGLRLVILPGEGWSADQVEVPIGQ